MYIPKRAILGAQLFMGAFVCYVMRVNLSVNLVAMVVHKPKEDQTDEEVNPDYGTRYDWDSVVQGYILGGYYWGVIPTSILGGYMAEMYSATHMIGITTILTAILNGLIPLASSMHWSLVVVLRVLMGLAGGVLFPTLHNLLSHWAPPMEKGKFMGCLMGGTLGTVLTWAVLGFIIPTWGWIWAYIAPSVFAFLWAVLWYMTVADTPDKHSTISEEERDYINDALKDAIRKEKKTPPYKHILLSLRFWALCISHYGNLWGLFFLLNLGPKYLVEVLNFNLKKSGVLSGAPHLARLIFGIIFGNIGDCIRKHEILSVTNIRRYFHLCSHILPGVCLILIGYMSNAYASVALLTMSLGLNGAATITNLQNSQDLAPNYAGTLYGIINAIGGTSGFIGAAVSGWITASGNTADNWRLNFWCSATIYICTAIFFIIFGTAEKQDFNELTWGDP